MTSKQDVSACSEELVLCDRLIITGQTSGTHDDFSKKAPVANSHI